MYTPDPLDTMRDMMQLFHVRLHLFKAPWQNLPELDFHLRESLFQNYDYHRMVRALREPLAQGMVFSCVDAFGSHYVSFLLETDGQPAPFEFAVMGPYRYRSISEQVIGQLMKKHSIPQRLQQDLATGLGRVPVIPQRDMWVNMQIFLISRLICKGKALKFYTPVDSGVALPDFEKPAYNPETSEHYQQMNLSGGYGQEEELLNAVKKGNIDQAARLAIRYVNFQTTYHKYLGLDPLCAIIGLNVLLRRAAMEVGVHILRLDETYVKYTRITNQQETGPIPATYIDMVTDYCKLVQKYSRQNYSTAVWKSLDHIDFHYQQNISLHKLATMFNVSDGYLSTSFKKEVGVSVTDYLNQTRIAHARWLLESTGASVQEISGQCGFSDGSYFTRIFKRYVGQSPLQYRAARSLL